MLPVFFPSVDTFPTKELVASLSTSASICCAPPSPGCSQVPEERVGGATATSCVWNLDYRSAKRRKGEGRRCFVLGVSNGPDVELNY